MDMYCKIYNYGKWFIIIYEIYFLFLYDILMDKNKIIFVIQKKKDFFFEFAGREK